MIDVKNQGGIKMALIVTGIILMCIGGGLWVYGDSVNNNIGRRIESFLSSGVINPGKEFVTIGTICFITGCLLIVCGVINKLYKLSQSKNINGKENSSLKIQRLGSFIHSISLLTLSAVMGVSIFLVPIAKLNTGSHQYPAKFGEKLSTHSVYNAESIETAITTLTLLSLFFIIMTVVFHLITYFNKQCRLNFFKLQIASALVNTLIPLVEYNLIDLLWKENGDTKMTFLYFGLHFITAAIIVFISAGQYKKAKNNKIIKP